MNVTDRFLELTLKPLNRREENALQGSTAIPHHERAPRCLHRPWTVPVSHGSTLEHLQWHGASPSSGRSSWNLQTDALRTLLLFLPRRQRQQSIKCTVRMCTFYFISRQNMTLHL